MAQLKSYIARFHALVSKAGQAQSRIKMLERMELIAPRTLITHSPLASSARRRTCQIRCYAWKKFVPAMATR